VAAAALRISAAEVRERGPPVRAWVRAGLSLEPAAIDLVCPSAVGSGADAAQLAQRGWRVAHPAMARRLLWSFNTQLFVFPARGLDSVLLDVGASVVCGRQVMKYVEVVL